MNLNYIEIQGFKSFRKKQRFSFSDFPSGLYFVEGENRVEPELGSNASGKSSIFSDCLLWILTGKTSLNLKAGNVQTWGDKIRCEGTLSFDKNGENYKIFRAWNPNKLELSQGQGGEKRSVSQEEVEDLTGFNFFSILYSMVISQFSSKFFDFRPEEKLRIFSDILGDIDKWLGFSKKADETATGIGLDITGLERVLDNLQGQIQSLGEQDYGQLIKDWEISHENRVEELFINIEEIEERLKKGRRSLKNKVEEVGKKRALLAKEREEFNKVVIELEKIENEIRVKERKEDALSFKIRQLEKEEKKLKELGDNCPYCGQKVSKQFIKDSLQKLGEKFDVILQESNSIISQIKKLKKEKEEIIKEKREVQKRKILAEDSSRVLEQELRSLEGSVEFLEVGLLNKGEDLQKEKKEKNPYLELEKEKATKIEHLERQVVHKTKEVEKLQIKKGYYVYWAKGFKEIRLLVIKEALTEFEIQINNNLQKLGLHDWKIRLDIDRETKSKTIQKGFYAFIESLDQKENVPLECYSGGERGRLRLGATLGLMDFINNRKGSGCNVEIFDEPTNSLSPEGEEDLIAILSERAKEEDKKIFLIDHHDLQSLGVFNGIIKVVKDAFGSHVER